MERATEQIREKTDYDGNKLQKSIMLTVWPETYLYLWSK